MYTESRKMVLLLLSHFSRVRLCVTPQTAAHQAPPSLGFSRQEHWSGLPFPSPMHESEKWKWSHSVVSDSWQPHGLQPTRLLRPLDFPAKSTGVGCICLLFSFTNSKYLLIDSFTVTHIFLHSFVIHNFFFYLCIKLNLKNLFFWATLQFTSSLFRAVQSLSIAITFILQL